MVWEPIQGSHAARQTSPPPLLPCRHKAGELNCELPIIISNHPDLAHIAATFGIEFRHIPMATRNAAGKAAQEAEIDTVLQVPSAGA